jgi:pyridoxine 5-phosphate synthase
MRATRQRLYINVDHVATLRQARRTDEPDPFAAAAYCERAGADGITAHLREDRRHIQDDDITRLARGVTTVLNLEMGCTPEMLAIAERLGVYQVTLVPERREEITTEGGLALADGDSRIAAAVAHLAAAGIRTSLFIDADPRTIRHAHAAGAAAIELHTGRYANAPRDPAPLRELREGARLGAELGLAVHAGHGLTLRNVGSVAAIPEIEELNIGHSIVSRALYVGIEEAVREMRQAMDAARS